MILKRIALHVHHQLHTSCTGLKPTILDKTRAFLIILKVKGEEQAGSLCSWIYGCWDFRQLEEGLCLFNTNV